MGRAITSWSAGLGALTLAGGLVGGGAPAASAAGGQSTSGVVVTATNPGDATGFSTMRLQLVARTAPSSVTDPSCRPQDVTLQCSGSLNLVVADFGRLSVTGFQLHRLAVGDISCRGGDEGDCGDGDTGSRPVVTGTGPAAAG